MTDTEHNPEDESREWEFEQGETLVKKDASQPSIPGHDVSAPEKTEYAVKRRLIDSDEGIRLYQLEWSEDAPKGSISDKNTKTMLYTATLVRGHYEREGGK